jgi:hypothetical protein
MLDQARRARTKTVNEQGIAFASQRASGTEPREGRGTPSSALTADAIADQLVKTFGELRPVQFSAVRYPGVDAVGHTTCAS